MAQLTIADYGTFEVADGTRLVLAIKDHGVDILHRCGGYARCTTCRVAFTEGEPTAFTEAELGKLTERGLLDTARLSCQIVCDHDMTLRVLATQTSEKLDDPGGQPEATLTPDPVWTTRS